MNAAHSDTYLTLISRWAHSQKRHTVIQTHTVQQVYLEAPQHDLLLHIVHAHILGAAAGQQESSIGAKG